ncbi:MAG: MYXO-CTERM domain-containing protein [Myxococcota bacterium]
MLEAPLLVVLAAVALADTCVYGAQEEVARVAGVPSESSGLAAARARPGWWYTHDDRGGSPELYAFDTAGNVGPVHRVVGAESEDWEDLAAGPCPDGGDCLYIADIGDNDAERDTITVYVVPEPQAAGEPVDVLETWSLVYPGPARDAETLLVHPCTAEVFLVTRPLPGEPAEVFRVPAGGGSLESIRTLTLSDSATSGDFDADGDRLVIRGEDAIWEWRVDPADPEAAFFGSPQALVAPSLEDAEAITYGPDGALWSTAEGLPMPLVRLPCTESTPAEHTCDPPVARDRGDDKSGCGCASGGVSGGWLLILAGLAARRRGIRAGR